MEVLGISALTVASPHGDALQGAAVPIGWFFDEAFPFDGCADDESPYGADPDSAYPEDPFPGGEYDDGDLPEDPFPEALFYEALFTSGDPSGADAPRLNVDDRVGAVKTLLRADLTAGGPGLIDQTTALEKFKKLGHRAASHACRRVRGEAAAGTS
jgi:hypothetical protein